MSLFMSGGVLSYGISGSVRKDAAMSVTISCRIKDIKAGMKHLKAALPKKKEQYNFAMIELTIRPDRLTMSTIGASYHFDCTADRFAKVILPAVVMAQIIKASKSETFKIECRQGEITFERAILSSGAIVLVHLENHSTIDLPMNYTAVDLLRLRKLHDAEELERMHVLDEVLTAEEDLADDISEAHILLGQYGVSEDDVRQLVHGQIFREG